MVINWSPTPLATLQGFAMSATIWIARRARMRRRQRVTKLWIGAALASDRALRCALPTTGLSTLERPPPRLELAGQAKRAHR